MLNFPYSRFRAEDIYYTATATPQNDTCSASEADPCDPATGKVFLTETDLPAVGNGLSFSRHYQSNDMNPTQGVIGVNWRHNFSQQIDAHPDQNVMYDLPHVRTGFYTTRDAACTQGVENIKAQLFGGRVADATVSYANNTCTLSHGGQPVANVVIHATGNGTSTDLPADVSRSIIRPNGDTYHFSYDNAGWVNLSGPGAALTEQGTQWTLTLTNGDTETYGPDGRLQQVVTPAGHTTRYSYAGGLLQSVTGPFGDRLDFSYLNGRIASVSGPQGRVDYAYDAKGNLSQVTYPDGGIKRYLYEDHYSPHGLTGVIDPNGNRTATWAYDREGRVVMNERTNGAEHFEFTYNPDGTTTVADANGGVRTYTFALVNGKLKFTDVVGDRCSTCGHGEDQARRYDGQGYLISRTDWNGVTTTYTRDATGLELSRTEAAGTPQARTITTEWHPTWRKPTRITEPDRVTDYLYSTTGQIESTRTVPTAP